MQIDRRRFLMMLLNGAGIAAASAVAVAVTPVEAAPKRASRRRRVCRWRGNQRVCRYEYRPELILRQF